MRHEGIKSFYDFRQVKPEELKDSANKLLEVRSRLVLILDIL